MFIPRRKCVCQAIPAHCVGVGLQPFTFDVRHGLRKYLSEGFYGSHAVAGGVHAWRGQRIGEVIRRSRPITSACATSMARSADPGRGCGGGHGDRPAITSDGDFVFPSVTGQLTSCLKTP